MKKHKIDEFDTQKVNDHELKAYYDFFMELLSEARPNDKKRPYEKFKQQILNVSNTLKVKHWVIWDNDKIAAYGMLFIYLEGENSHIVDADLFTLPKYRNQGMADQILVKLYEYCQQNKLTIMEFSTFSTTPSGSVYLKQLGAKLGKTENVYRLFLNEIDPNLIQNWISRAKERSQDYELELWENETSTEKIEQYITLYNDFVNSEPMGDLDYEEEEYTVERLQEDIAVNTRKGWIHWLLVARHKPSDTLAGFTEIVYTGFDKEMLLQFGTGVLQKHRNKGLGRWLKAEMIELIKAKMPDIKWIRSHNATINKAMTKINEELGFRVESFEEYWHISTDEVGKYLKKKGLTR